MGAVGGRGDPDGDPAVTVAARSEVMDRLNRLREEMDEADIFIQLPGGQVALSPKAARRLADMHARDEQAWRDAHRGQAAEAAAAILDLYQAPDLKEEPDEPDCS